MNAEDSRTITLSGCGGATTTTSTIPGTTTTTLPSTDEAGIWHFNENSGATAYDSSGNGNDGVISGAQWTTGRNGSALLFDGVDDYVDVGNNPSVNIVDELTIELWVKFTSLPTTSYERLIEKGVWTEDDSRCSYRLLRGMGSKDVGFEMCTDSSYYYGWMGELEINQWYHLVGTYKSGEMRTYVDGSLIEEKTDATGSIQQTPDPLAIGANSGHAENLHGILDEVKIYRRALTPEEVSEHYNQQQ